MGSRPRVPLTGAVGLVLSACVARTRVGLGKGVGRGGRRTIIYLSPRAPLAAEVGYELWARALVSRLRVRWAWFYLPV